MLQDHYLPNIFVSEEYFYYYHLSNASGFNYKRLFKVSYKLFTDINLISYSYPNTHRYSVNFAKQQIGNVLQSKTFLVRWVASLSEDKKLSWRNGDIFLKYGQEINVICLISNFNMFKIISMLTKKKYIKKFRTMFLYQTNALWNEMALYTLRIRLNRNIKWCCGSWVWA